MPQPSNKLVEVIVIEGRSNSGDNFLENDSRLDEALGTDSWKHF